MLAQPVERSLCTCRSSPLLQSTAATEPLYLLAWTCGVCSACFAAAPPPLTTDGSMIHIPLELGRGRRQLGFKLTHRRCLSSWCCRGEGIWLVCVTISQLRMHGTACMTNGCGGCATNGISPGRMDGLDIHVFQPKTKAAGSRPPERGTEGQSRCNTAARAAG